LTRALELAQGLRFDLPDALSRRTAADGQCAIERQVPGAKFCEPTVKARPNSDLPLVGFDTRKLPSGSGALTHLHILVHCVPHLNASGFYHFGAEQRSQEQAGPSNSLK
jgi:hypothetical protein